MRLSFVRRPRNAIGYGETVNPHAPHEGGHDSLHLGGTAIIHDVAMPIACCLFDDRGQGIENQTGTIVTEQDDRRCRRPSLCEFVPWAQFAIDIFFAECPILRPWAIANTEPPKDSTSSPAVIF